MCFFFQKLKDTHEMLRNSLLDEHEIVHSELVQETSEIEITLKVNEDWRPRLEKDHTWDQQNSKFNVVQKFMLFGLNENTSLVQFTNPKLDATMSTRMHVESCSKWTFFQFI